MARPSQALQAEVRRRAGGRCEYIPGSSGRITLSPRPQKHRGQTEPANLASACFSCNLRKGPNIAGRDRERDELAPLFNPRLDTWFQHFGWEGRGFAERSPLVAPTSRSC